MTNRRTMPGGTRGAATPATARAGRVGRVERVGRAGRVGLAGHAGLAGLVALALALSAGATGCAGRQRARERAAAERTEAEGRRLRLDLAEMYVQRRAYDAAVPLLRRAVAEEPRNASVRALYGTVLRERGLYPQAEREFLAAQRLAPTHAPAWAGAGILYDLMSRHEEALTAHRRSVRLAPRAAGYWNNLGFSLYVAGRTDEAIAALEQALALDPSLLTAHNNLGFAYGRRGDYAAAERCFRAAGDERAARLNLALAHERNGDIETAERLRGDATAATAEEEPR